MIDGDVFEWQRAGGISRLFANTIPLLDKNGSGVMASLIVGSRIAPTLCSELHQYVLPWHEFRAAPLPWVLWSRIMPRLNSMSRACAFLRSRADVFLSTYYTVPSLRMPTIAVLYDMIIELYPEQFDSAYATEISARKRLCIEKADLVICISQNTLRDAVTMLGMHAGKGRVVYPAPGICPGMVQPVLPDELRKRPFLLVVGNHMMPYKNVRFVVDCLSSSEFSEWSGMELVVVSSGAAGNYGELSGGKIGGRTRLIRGCDDELLAGLYEGCAAFIYPSVYEGFGIPVLEALSFGAPVACSHASSLREVGGDVVCYFDPASRTEFKTALAAALGEGRDEAYVRLREKHAGRFTWQKTAAGFADAARAAAGK